MTTLSESSIQIGRWSLRKRIALASGFTAALVLTCTATVVFLVARTQMIADYDRTWQARGESVPDVQPV